MSDLFKKINVLVKASLSDLLPDTDKSERRRELTPERLGKNIDHEVSALRKRIDDALDYESGLKRKVAALEEEIALLDSQADDALRQGREDSARHLVEAMQRAQQRLAMAQGDLREHQLVTQDFISRVNMLEAVVAEARRREQPQAAQPEPGRVPSLADVLREAREKIAAMGDLVSAKDEVQRGNAAESPPADVEVSPKAVDDDLQQRRQRLSK